MLKSYITVAGEGKTNLIVQRSRFICQANWAPTEAVAVDFIEKIKRTYHDATHHCYAYLIATHQQKSSDDGEPAGTAGRPILETIHHHQLQQTVIVITRYFGGIKLGTGGLVRAYSEAAQQAIQSAQIIHKKPHQELICVADFSLWGKLEHYIRGTDYQHEHPVFTDHVEWSIWVPIEQVTTFIKQLTDWSHGKLQITNGKMKHLDT